MWKNNTLKPWPEWLSWLGVTCKPKGRWFNSRSGHMPGSQVWSPAGAHAGGNWSVFLSLSLSLLSPLSGTNKRKKKEQYTEKYKTFLKDTKATLMDWKMQYRKDNDIPKVTYRFDIIPTQTPTPFAETDKLILNFTRNCKRPRKRQNNLEKTDQKLESLHVLISKLTLYHSIASSDTFLLYLVSI